MDFQKRIEEIGIDTLAESIGVFQERVRTDINSLNEERDDLQSVLIKRKREENELNLTYENGPARKKQKIDTRTPIKVGIHEKEINAMENEDDEDDTNEEEEVDGQQYITPPVNVTRRFRRGTESKDSQASLELISPSKTKQVQTAIDFQQANEEFQRMEQMKPSLPPQRKMTASEFPESPVMEINRRSQIEPYLVKELHERSWKPIRNCEYIIMVKFSPVELVIGVLTNLRIILARFVGTDLVIFQTIEYDRSGKSEVEKICFTPDGKFVVICGKLLLSPNESQDIFRGNYSYCCRLYPILRRRRNGSGEEEEEFVDEDEDDDEEEEIKRRREYCNKNDDDDGSSSSSSSSDSELDIFSPKTTKKKKKKKKKNKKEMFEEKIVSLQETKSDSKIICALFPKEEYFSPQWRTNRKMIVVTEKEILMYYLYRQNWGYEDHNPFKSAKGGEDEDEEDEDDSDDDADTQIDFEKVKKRRRKFVCGNILHREKSNSLLMIATNQNTIEFWVIQKREHVVSYIVPDNLNIQITKIKSLLLNKEGLYATIKFETRVTVIFNPDLNTPSGSGNQLNNAKNFKESRKDNEEDVIEEEEEEGKMKKMKNKTGFGLIFIQDKGVRMFNGEYDLDGNFDFTCCEWIADELDFSYLIAGTRKLEMLIYKVNGQMMGKLEHFGFSESILREEMGLVNKVKRQRSDKEKYEDDEEEEEEDDDDDDEEEDFKKKRVGFNSIDRHCKYPLIAFSVRKGVSIFYQKQK